MYEGVVEHSYKKSNRSDANHDVYNRQMRREAASSKIYSGVGKRSGKRKQRYVDHLRGQSKPTCLIHSP